MADTTQAEFLYKVKPKLQNQFKAAEAGGVPFALILGEVSNFPPLTLWRPPVNSCSPLG